MISDPVLASVGAACILMGIAFVWVGDKELPLKGMFSAHTPKFSGMKWLKWPMGIALIGAGLKIISLAQA